MDGHHAVDLAVLGQQHAHRARFPEQGSLRTRLRGLRGEAGCGFPESRGEPESRTLARGAFEADLAPHESDELLGDGQAQAGAPELAGGRGVGLRERVENPGLRLKRNPDTLVGDAELEEDPGGWRLGDVDADLDLAFLGKFDGVSDEVVEHLAEAAGVAAENAGDLRREQGHEAELFGHGAGGVELHHALEQLREHKIARLHFHVARLDLGEVQDVVDDGQQRMRAGLDGVGQGELAGCERRLQEHRVDSDDPVERGADLVAHVGEELRLGAVGLLGFLLGPAHGFLRLFLDGDVSGDSKKPRDPAPGVAQGGDGEHHRKTASILPHVGPFALGDHGGGRARHKSVKLGGRGDAGLRAQDPGAPGDFRGIMEIGEPGPADHLPGVVA